MTVRAEDLGYPPVAELRARREAIERRRAAEIREGAARLARGEAPPRRHFTERHRARLHRSALDRYFEVVLSDPAAPPLRKLRALEQIDLGTLSERASVGRRTIQRAEAGEHISATSWRRLADALGVEPEAISRTELRPSTR